jgi:hypothetical protein
MNLKPWNTWAVVLAVIMTVGCSAAAAPAAAPTVAPTVAPTPWGTPIILEDYLIDGPVDQPEVEALEARVEELEARLEGLRWTEEEAIAVVQREISDRLVACQEHSHDVQDGRGTFGMRVDGLGTGESGGCAYHEDIVLRGTGFRTTNFGINLGGSITEVLLESPGSWTAVYESRFHRWRVEALAPDIPTMSFHVYERTGLVVGVAPTGQ